MTADDLFQRPAEGPRVEPPGQHQGEGQVVGGATGLELIHQPQALLGEGEARRAAARNVDQGRRPVAAPLLPRLPGPPGEARHRGLAEKVT